MKSLLLLLSCLTLGLAQDTCDIPDKRCCHEDCCAAGTSWNEAASTCVEDPGSPGWRGVYSDFYYDYCDDPMSCCNHPCCEDDCCGAGTTWDNSIAYCVPQANVVCGPTGTGITFINCMLCSDSATDATVCPLGKATGDTDQDGTITATDLIEDYDPLDPKDVLRERVRILHVLEPLNDVKVSRRLLYANVTELLSDDEVLMAEVKAYQNMWEYLLIAPKVGDEIYEAFELWLQCDSGALKQDMRRDEVEAEAISETLVALHAILNDALLDDIDRGINRNALVLTDVQRDALLGVSLNLEKYIPILNQHISLNDLQAAADVLDLIKELMNVNMEWPREALESTWDYFKTQVIDPVRTSNNLETTEKRAKLAIQDAFGAKRAAAILYIAIDLQPYFDSFQTAMTTKDKKELWNKEMKNCLDEAKEISFVYEPGTTEISWTWNINLVDAIGGSLEVTAAIHCLCDDTLEWAETRFAPVDVNVRQTTTRTPLDTTTGSVEIEYDVPLESQPACGPECCYFAPLIVGRNANGRAIYGPVYEFQGVLMELSAPPTAS